MTDHPILFSAPMVQAILENRKKQTRRIAKFKFMPGQNPDFSGYSVGQYCTGVPSTGWVLYSRGGGGCWNQRTERLMLPNVGDRLWVRESCYIWGMWVLNGMTKTGRKGWRFLIIGERAMYEDNRPAIVLGPKTKNRPGWFKRPSIHAPRWASRILLEVTDMQVERLQETTPKDAAAEGFVVRDHSKGIGFVSEKDPLPSPYDPKTNVEAFKQTWNHLNSKRGFGWDKNPWVWAITFKRLKP